MSSFGVGWIAAVLVRNAVVLVAWYGVFHLRLYVRRAQDTRFKYNAKWPAAPSGRFTFGSQTKENVFWTLASGLPIWTAWEVVTLWLFASGRIPWIRLDRPSRVVRRADGVDPALPGVALLRGPPVDPLAAAVQDDPQPPSPQHQPGPVVRVVDASRRTRAVLQRGLVHWVVPSHPIHAMYTLFHLAMAPVPGHSGFEQLEVGDGSIATNGYAHYLHHKYFEVNYADGAFPLDQVVRLVP